MTPARAILGHLGSARAVKWVIVVLVGLVVADGVITNVLVRQGIAREGNPVLETLAGKDLLVIAKVAGAGACAFLLWDIYRHWRRLGLASAYGFLLLYITIVAWNLSLLLGAAGRG